MAYTGDCECGAQASSTEPPMMMRSDSNEEEEEEEEDDEAIEDRGVVVRRSASGVLRATQPPPPPPPPPHLSLAMTNHELDEEEEEEEEEEETESDERHHPPHHHQDDSAVDEVSDESQHLMYELASVPPPPSVPPPRCPRSPRSSSLHRHQLRQGHLESNVETASYHDFPLSTNLTLQALHASTEELLDLRSQLHELSKSVESCQSDVFEVRQDVMSIKHEIDSVQMVKEEIDDIRTSLERLEADGERRKAKLLQQGLTLQLAFSIFTAVLGMLQFGYNTGVINAPETVIEKFIRHTHRVANDGQNLTYESSTFLYAVAVAIFALGGMLGGFVGGWIANTFGRRGGLFATNAIGIVGAMGMASAKYSESYRFLIAGRFLIGVNCGLNTSLVPMYISEIAPLTLRGGLGTVNQLAVTVGLLVSQVLGLESLLGSDEGWPHLLGLAVLPPALQTILLPFCPESPRYLLITRQQEAKARAALRRLRNTMDIDADLSEMRAEELAQRTESKIGFLEVLRSPTLRLPLLIAVMMQLSQQLSGINAVFYYSTNLFITTGLPESHAKLATIGIGCVMVAMTLCSIPLMDRSGRRSLHLYGLGGMFIFSIFITISFLVKELVAWIWWLSVVSTLLYVVFFAVGPGSIPWMITAELFSQGPRPAAMSVAVLVNWSANFCVGIGFPTMQTLLENYIFLPFSLFLAIFWIFTYKKVPETKNKTFDEIATLFRSGGQKRQRSLRSCMTSMSLMTGGTGGCEHLGSASKAVFEAHMQPPHPESMPPMPHSDHLHQRKAELRERTASQEYPLLMDSFPSSPRTEPDDLNRKSPSSAEYSSRQHMYHGSNTRMPRSVARAASDSSGLDERGQHHAVPHHGHSRHPGQQLGHKRRRSSSSRERIMT